jgi:hypothetical protein
MDWRPFTRQGHEPDNSPTQGIFVEPRSCCPVNANFLASPAALLSAFPASMAVSLSADYPPPGDGWASMVNTQLCPCSRNRPRPTTTPRVTTRLAASKLSTLYGGGNLPRLGEIPSVFQRPYARQQWLLYHAQQRCIHDDGDLIFGQHAPGIGRVPRASFERPQWRPA